jgi:proteic killer suppression protein
MGYIASKRCMIKSFKHKGLEKLFTDGSTKGIQVHHQTKLEDILDILDAMVQIQDINFPGAKLHKLEPKKENKWSISVSGNWRITFKFIENDIYAVDYLDYH